MNQTAALSTALSYALGPCLWQVAVPPVSSRTRGFSAYRTTCLRDVFVSDECVLTCSFCSRFDCSVV